MENTHNVDSNSLKNELNDLIDFLDEQIDKELCSTPYMLMLIKKIK